MSTFTRTDTSLVGRWWWTVDRWTLGAVIALAAVGGVMALAATPPVAERIGLDTFHFAKRHFVLLPVAMAVMLGISLATPKGVRRMAVVVLMAGLALTLMTVLFGSGIKGAERWIRIAGFSLQPSEFVKIAYPVVAAWMFAAGRLDHRFPGALIATLMLGVVVGLFLAQPDVGMTLVVAAVWGVQFFLAGLPLVLVVSLAMVTIIGFAGSYFVFDHVRSRVDRFLDPASGDTYQISRSLEAFSNGGVFGTGPGEGAVKAVLPDAHADFVFAVAGEEFGLIACLLILGLYGFVVLRGFSRLFEERDLFVLLAASGLLTQFGLQALINMASTLHLIPTKGMTLPLVSYGGSSLLATGIALGMLLALTRERPGGGR